MNPDGTVQQSVYDSEGRVAWEVDRHVVGQAAMATHTVYDLAGRVIGTERYSGTVVTVTTTGTLLAGNLVAASVLAAGGTLVSSTSTHYDGFGRVDYAIDAANQKTSYEYDALGRQTAVVDALGDRTSYTYDALGRKATMTDALKNTTTYGYDNLGHLTRTTYADGSYIDTHYDIYNNKSAVSVQHKDGEDPRWTNYAYDYAGRLTDVYLAAVVDPQNGNVQTRPHTQYGYDTFGNELMQTDTLRRVTTFHYCVSVRRPSS